MNDKQIEFERKHFQRIRDGFREATKETGNESLQQILKRLIVEKKYTEIVEKIKLQYDFTVTSMFMENINSHLNQWTSLLVQTPDCINQIQKVPYSVIPVV